MTVLIEPVSAGLWRVSVRSPIGQAGASIRGERARAEALAERLRAGWGRLAAEIASATGDMA